MKRQDIEAIMTVCPYCMNEVYDPDRGGCCGESSAHFAVGYVVGDETYLEHEIVVID